MSCQLICTDRTKSKKASAYFTRNRRKKKKNLNEKCLVSSTGFHRLGVHAKIARRIIYKIALSLFASLLVDLLRDSISSFVVVKVVSHVMNSNVGCDLS